MTSIRFHIGRWNEGREVLIERVSDYLRHVIIESQPSDNCGLRLLLTVDVYPEAIGAEGKNMQRAEISATYNDVNHQFLSLSQINIDRRFDVSHFPSQGSAELAKALAPQESTA